MSSGSSFNFLGGNIHRAFHCARHRSSTSRRATQSTAASAWVTRLMRWWIRRAVTDCESFNIPIVSIVTITISIAISVASSLSVKTAITYLKFFLRSGTLIKILGPDRLISCRSVYHSQIVRRQSCYCIRMQTFQFLRHAAYPCFVVVVEVDASANLVVVNTNAE